MIKHISFDCWETLIKSNPKYKEELAKRIRLFLSVTFNITVSKIDILAWRNSVASLANKINFITGKAVKQEELIVLWLNACSVNSNNISIAHVQRVISICNEVYSFHMPLFIDSDAFSKIITKCTRKNITLSILSNTGFITGAQLQLLLLRSGIVGHFKFLLFSDETNRSKPHRDAFTDLWMNTRSIESREILHVGDDLINDGACENLGISFLPIYGKTRNTIEKINDLI